MTYREHAESEKVTIIPAFEVGASYSASHDHRKGGDCLDGKMTQHLVNLGCVEECISAWPALETTLFPDKHRPLPGHPGAKQARTCGQSSLSVALGEVLFADLLT